MQAIPNYSIPDYSRPWLPIVLSLDGGGVRGLSSLYILREIMKMVKVLDDNASTNERIETDAGIPLPCNYFDFIIGTSTGGLIAIMLGRLRMSVNDCIQQYWTLSIQIFRPPITRGPFRYSGRTIQQVTQDVVGKFCQCHGTGNGNCNGKEHLRQYDYGEETDPLDAQYRNKSCRVAVVTVRGGGSTSFDGRQQNVKVLLRSYNHRRREYRADFIESEPNPKGLESSKLMVHEACSVTTAAPTYFAPVKITGRKYIDGGVMANNPVKEAWNEAMQMAVPPGQFMPGNNKPLPNLLVSIGTGKKREISGLGLRALLRFGLRKIADTEPPHRDMQGQVTQYSWRYHRFNVPWNAPTGRDYEGLDNIKLDQCRKKKNKNRQSIQQQPLEQNSPQQNGQPQNNLPPNTLPPNAQPQNGPRQDEAIVNAVVEEDRPLREAAANAEPRRRDGYKPEKYDYTTFDRLRDRSVIYCNSVQGDITTCARILREFHVRRKRDNSVRWDQFRKHPDPRHPTNA